MSNAKSAIQKVRWHVMRKKTEKQKSGDTSKQKSGEYLMLNALC